MTALLNNRYRILKVLGAGGFGITSIAEDVHLPSLRRCVVKELKPATDDPRLLQIIKERFQKEAATLEMLAQTSRQVPGLYAYFSENERFYLVQELIEGPTLTQYVTQNGPRGEEEAKHILTSLLTLLEYVHGQGIIHRDIKPDNVLLRKHDGQPVLIDFGAVKETVTSTLDSAGRATASIVIGTPGFIPLEQAAGRPLYSSDLYSLGLTIVFLLTAKIPQELTDQATGAIRWTHLVRDLSPAFAAIIEKAIEPDSRTRYKSAREMLTAMAQLSAKPVEQDWQQRETLAATPPPAFPSQSAFNAPTEHDLNVARETQRMTPPPIIPSQPIQNPASQHHPPSYPISQQAPPPSPMPPPSEARQTPTASPSNPYPSPQPHYPPQQQYRSGAGGAVHHQPSQPPRVAKKGMSGVTKVMLVIGGLVILGFIGIVGLLVLVQFASVPNAQQSSLPQSTATPLAIADSPTPYSQDGKGATSSPYTENALDVTGRWKFNLTMLDGATMSDALVLAQDGNKITGWDDDGQIANGSLNGNKLSLAYKQPLSAEERVAMAPLFGNIQAFIMTISGKEA